MPSYICSTFQGGEGCKTFPLIRRKYLSFYSLIHSMLQRFAEQFQIPGVVFLSDFSSVKGKKNYIYIYIYIYIYSRFFLGEEKLNIYIYIYIYIYPLEFYI